MPPHLLGASLLLLGVSSDDYSLFVIRKRDMMDLEEDGDISAVFYKEISLKLPVFIMPTIVLL